MLSAHFRGMLHIHKLWAIEQFKHNQALEQLRIEANVYLLHALALRLTIYLLPSLSTLFSPFLFLPYLPLLLSVCLSPALAASIVAALRSLLPRCLSYRSVKYYAYAVPRPNWARPHPGMSIIQFANFYSNKISAHWKEFLRWTRVKFQEKWSTS